MKQIHPETCGIHTFWEENMNWKLHDENSKFNFHCTFVANWQKYILKEVLVAGKFKGQI